MILNAGNKSLRCVKVVWQNEVNNIYVCELIGAIKSYYIVWEVKERVIAKELLKCGKYECFTYLDSLCFLFPYEEPRLIKNYYYSVISEYPSLREKILRECVISCMNSEIPYPLLYLMLEQEQVFVEKDGSVQFGYLLNLEGFSNEKGEAECADSCARLVKELLEKEKKQNTMGIVLLERKLEKSGYKTFKELFRDIRLITEDKKKRKYSKGVKEKIKSKKDIIFRFLLRLCGVLLIIVIIMLLVNLFFGDVSFYQLFQQSLKQIGTESLLQ